MNSCPRCTGFLARDVQDDLVYQKCINCGLRQYEPTVTPNYRPDDDEDILSALNSMLESKGRNAS